MSFCLVFIKSADRLIQWGLQRNELPKTNHCVAIVTESGLSLERDPCISKRGRVLHIRADGSIVSHNLENNSTAFLADKVHK